MERPCEGKGKFHEEPFSSSEASFLAKCFSNGENSPILGQRYEVSKNKNKGAVRQGGRSQEKIKKIRYGLTHLAQYLRETEQVSINSITKSRIVSERMQLSVFVLKKV